MGARGTKPKENAAAEMAEAGKLAALSSTPPASIKGGEDANREWKRVVAELRKMPFIRAINRQSLINYCEAYAIGQMALDEIHRDGITLEGNVGGRYAHPAVNVWSMARGTMEKEAKNLGMTPMSLQSMKGAKSTANGSKKSKEAREPKPSDYL